MSHHNKDSAPPDARRRPRIEVDGYCFLRDISHAVPLEIIDISLGGMQLCAAEAMRIGERRVILPLCPGHAGDAASMRRAPVSSFGKT